MPWNPQDPDRSTPDVSAHDRRRNEELKSGEAVKKLAEAFVEDAFADRSDRDRDR